MEPSDIAEAISRISRMEACFSSLQQAASIADDPALREKLQVLTDYYENGLWLQDYELDEKGLLPQDLKRGVLSQDALFDFFEDIFPSKIAERNLTMFRNLTRVKQQLSREEAVALLKSEPRGVLSLIGDEGYPYGLPIDHWYNEEDGYLYFHSGPKGHKIDAMKACSKASFCVHDQGFRKDGDWALNIKSVIVFGRIEILQDHEKAVEMTRLLSLKYTSDIAYIEQEIRLYGHEVLVFRLIPEHITGKITKES